MWLVNIVAEIKCTPLAAQFFLCLRSPPTFGSANIWYILYLLRIALDFWVPKFIQEYFNTHSAENLMQSLSLFKGGFLLS